MGPRCGLHLKPISPNATLSVLERRCRRAPFCSVHHSSSLAGRGPGVGLPNHGKQLNCRAIVIALELLGKSEAEAAVDLRVWLVAAGLEVAFQALGVGLVGDGLHHGLAHALTLGLGNDDHDVQKVVSPRIRPDGRLGIGLSFLPDVISLAGAGVSRSLTRDPPNDTR
jgi:hypothetical protein